MGEAAVKAALAVGYQNAGTVEFLLEGSGEGAHFYFLEMNTRLQVEHPVTEAVTGVDLVKAQLAVAAGEPLPWSQDELRQRGHAIECRIYAEDPARDFLPQAGRVIGYYPPVRPGVRIDSGVEAGSEVTVHYDPMVAKLVAHAESRDAAIARARAALAEFDVLGLVTNIPFLLRVLDSDAFRRGELHTGFLDREGSDLGASPAIPAAALAAAVVHDERAVAPNGSSAAAARPDPWSTIEGWRV